MNRNVAPLLDELKAGLKEVYGDRLKGLYVYGSSARGDADSDSDVDLLVVLDHIARYGPEIEATSHLRAELSLYYGVSISTVFVREGDWAHGDTPFLRNVRDEAVAA